MFINYHSQTQQIWLLKPSRSLSQIVETINTIACSIFLITPQPLKSIEKSSDNLHFLRQFGIVHEKNRKSRHIDHRYSQRQAIVKQEEQEQVYEGAHVAPIYIWQVNNKDNAR